MTYHEANLRTKPALHEAKDEAEARYYEAEAKKMALLPCWPQGLNIPGDNCHRPVVNQIYSATGSSTDIQEQWVKIAFVE